MQQRGNDECQVSEREGLEPVEVCERLGNEKPRLLGLLVDPVLRQSELRADPLPGSKNPVSILIAVDDDVHVLRRSSLVEGQGHRSAADDEDLDRRASDLVPQSRQDFHGRRAT